ncbi:MAG TPA: hypothetical protein VFX17_04105 [Patescibacteria group bacterium]|nr:hypothetical protein [Patescibacteria group bacterium]
MRHWTEQLFYSLSAVLLLAAAFVLQPARNSDVAQFQQSVKHQFQVATLEVIGDRPWFGEVNLIVSSVNEFYQESADAVIVALTPAPTESGVAYIGNSMIHEFAQLLTPAKINQPAVAVVPTFQIPANFMQEPPIDNIIPAGDHKNPVADANGAQASISAVQSIASANTAINDGLGSPWVNLRDSDTGQVYCVAIFNAEVNRYIGPCKDEYH